MALPTVIAKNQTVLDINIPELGVDIPGSGQYTFTTDSSDKIFTFFEVASSKTLKDNVSSGDIVINDGTSDLSTARALNYLDSTGNLNGPDGATADNSLIRFDGVTGRFTETTGITVDNSDNMDLGAGDITTTGTITGGTGALDVSTTPTANYIPRAYADTYLDSGWTAQAQVIIVALSGSADFTSVKDAVDSISDASAIKPYTIKVASGIYTESPFNLKSYVAIIGESMITTEIRTNDNNAHFITGAAGALLKNLAIKGPTGTGFAAINHIEESTTPLQIHHSVIRAGYYGIWCHPAASRGIVHAFFVGNWYSGSRIENFFRASNYGNITAIVCNFMNGASSACGTGFYVTGNNAEMTLDGCSHRNKGSDNAIFVDDGAKVRALAFAFSRALNGIHIGPTGTNSRAYTSGCTMRRDLDTATITAFADHNGTVPSTTLVTSASHGMLTGAHVMITSSAPGTYDGHHIITKVDTNSFYIVVTYNGDLVPATYTVGAIQGSNILISAGANLPIIEYGGGTIRSDHIIDGGVGTKIALGASDLLEEEDDESGSFVVFDELRVGTLVGTIPVGHYLRDTGFTGYYGGGAVTDAGGLTVNVAPGTGWINTGTGMEPVDWLAQAGVALTDDSENYVYIDVNGDVQVTASEPSSVMAIVIAEVVTAAGDIIMNASHRIPIAQQAALFHTYAQEVLQNRWVSGLTVTATSPASLGFVVGSGAFYLADYRLTPAASATPCAFTLLYRDGAGGWVAITGYASGTITVNSTLAAGDTITIGGITLTGVAGARTPGSDDFDASLGTVGALATEIAAAINDVINSFAVTVSASALAAVVTITSVVPGFSGDLITLAELTAPPGGLTVSGGLLAGGDAGITEVPLTWDDNSGTPVALAVGKWAKHMSWVTEGDDGTQHFVQMGQEIFDSELFAIEGNNPAPFDFLEDDACRLYGIVVSDASASIDSFVREVLEIGTSGSGDTGASSHSILSELSSDDHPQYSLLSGNAARNPVTGTFNFGGGNLLLPLEAMPSQTINGSAVWDSDGFRLTVGDGTTRKSLMNQGDSAGGDLSGTYPNPSVYDITIAGEVQGSILYYNGVNWAQLPPDTAGQVLTTNGAAANPSWDVLDLQVAYDNGNSIVTAAATDILFTLTSGGFTVNGSGAINLGNGATVQTVNVGTGAAAKTITVGNTAGATVLNLTSGTGNVNTTTAMAWNGAISPTSLATSQNDYNPTGLSGAVTISQDCSAHVNITGLAGGIEGRIIIIHNNSTLFRITLKGQSASSLAANRFNSSVDIILPPQASIFLRYDDNDSRWTCIGLSATASTGLGKSRFTPFASNATSAVGNHATISLGANASTQFECNAPSDVVQLIAAYVIGIGGTTNASANIDLTTSYFNPLIGEAFNTHTETDTTSTYSITSTLGFLLPITSILTSLAANDFIGTTVKHNAVGGANNYIGMLFIYT